MIISSDEDDDIGGNACETLYKLTSISGHLRTGGHRGRAGRPVQPPLLPRADANGERPAYLNGPREQWQDILSVECNRQQASSSSMPHMPSTVPSKPRQMRPKTMLTPHSSTTDTSNSPVTETSHNRTFQPSSLIHHLQLGRTEFCMAGCMAKWPIGEIWPG